ncbi:MAG: flagellar basal-body MS-ring/collar protein FliF, partial [Pseudomonadota bacterium]
MRNLLAFLENFGLARLATTVGVTGGVALALILIMVRIGAEPYQILATDLDYADAQAVISELERGGQDYQMREHGARVSILVPRDRVGTIRLSLASEGLLNNSTVGYEIFDKQQSLGTTSFQQNLNRVRALEGELARSVSAISGVRSARVHLVLPERALFARDQQQPSASIMVDVTGRLGQGPIAAITNLVASAVPALSPNQITILDNRGNLLAAAHELNSEAAQGAMISDRIAAAQTRLQTTVNDLIGRIVGPENVRARVAADFDVSRVTETAEIVDPDSQVVLSSTLIEESADDNRPARGVSVGNALPNATISDQIGDADRSQTRRTEEITNYEITKTVRNAVRDQGLVLNGDGDAVEYKALIAHGI